MATQRRTRRGTSQLATTDNNSSGKEKSEIDAVLAEIRKRYGNASVTKASSIIQPVRIPTSIFMVDFALLGGIPSNRITMVVGEKHAGKTVFSDKCAGGAQRTFPNQKVAYVDVEGTHDTLWAQKLGVDTDEMIVAQPETGESAVDMADALVRTREVSLVVIDSIAALTPMKEIESSAEDAHVGIQARLVGGMIRKVSAGLIAERLRGHFVTVVFVNQYRTKIGGWSPTGEAKSIPGGRALEFCTSVQIVMKNKENQGKDRSGRGLDIVTENEHAFTVTKNKLNGGIRSGEFRLLRQDKDEYGLHEGDIDDLSTMLVYAKKFGAYSGGGSSWNLQFWEDDHNFRGLEDAITTIYQDPDMKQRLRDYLIWEQARVCGMDIAFLDRFTTPHNIEIEYE